MRQNIFIPPPIFKHHLLYPVGIGHYYDFPTHHEHRQSGFLKEYNLHLVLRGKGYVVHQGEKLELTAGCGFLFPKGAEQHYGTDENDPWEICFVHFNAFDPLLSMWKLDQSEGWFFRFNSIQQVQEIFTGMFDLMENFKTANEPHLASLIYELLLYLLNYSEPLANTSTLNNTELIHKIADHIFDHPAFDWTTQSMAELSGYSVYHFIRLFQKIMDIKPNEYVTQCRISAAKNLLLSTEAPIYEIASQIGFAQASYFISVFKKHTELSPQAYRNMFRQS